MREFVRELLDRKVLVSPDLLEKAKTKSMEELVKLSSHSIVLTNLESRQEVEITGPIKKDKMTPADISAFYRSKFTSLKKLLELKIKPISISKASGTFSDIEVTGIVKERNESGFVLEDETGTLNIKYHSQPDIGDVVAAKGFVREGVMFAKDVGYPDIPLKRRIGEAERKIVLCDRPVSTQADYIFSLIEQANTTLIPNPAHIKITAGGTAMITAYKPPSPISVKEAEKLLLKRHLMISPAQIACPADSYAITEVPDVLWIASDKNEKSIYKGVLIVLSPACMVDLSTKEVEFL